MEIIIRKETKDDYIKVYELVKAAFKEAEHSDLDEQNLVERLRKSDAFLPELTLVAEFQGKLVGHIMFTKLDIEGTEALSLAPVSVKPDLQKMGIGGTLIEAGHKKAKELGYDIIVVLGHAEYYPKFGYIPASNFGIKASFEIGEANFMACSLQGNKTIINGTVQYPKEFFENN